MTNKSKGFIYYNYGEGCLARLAVSAYSLRKHYDGPVTIISDGEESNRVCRQIAADERIRFDIVEPKVDVRAGKNHHYLAKCRLHELTPYDVSLFIDSDTVVTGDLTPLFSMAEENEFVTTQFCDWQSNGRMISKRILEWKDIRPRDMKRALRFGPAVNTGVMAFTKESAFMKDWFRVARRGRGFYIPDEVSCQVILWRYPHKVVDSYYNASCRYDDCDDPEVRLIHYHGRKHCREGLPFNGDKWVAAYNEVVDLNIGNIREWTPSSDRHLSRHLSSLNRRA